MLHTSSILKGANIRNFILCIHSPPACVKKITEMKEIHILLKLCFFFKSFSSSLFRFPQLLLASCTPAWTATLESHTNLRGSGLVSCGVWQCSSASTTPVLYPFYKSNSYICQTSIYATVPLQEEGNALSRLYLRHHFTEEQIFDQVLTCFQLQTLP